MDCKANQKMLPAFLAGKLETRELKQFLIHVENCEECMEELTIQYLVMTGAAILEEGNSFDLHKELEGLLEEARKRVRKRRILTIFSYLCEIFAILAVILILIMVVFG
ncbi:MAG: zf-HC2 domain-containing protein [Lachnospiraceae bacterium]|nr:zf-HC2 domain-containing protein [Lachnospiraceae bacterium]